MQAAGGARPGIHTFRRSIAEQSILQVFSLAAFPSVPGLVMLPGKGISDEATVGSTYCLITIATVCDIDRASHTICERLALVPGPVAAAAVAQHHSNTSSSTPNCTCSNLLPSQLTSHAYMILSSRVFPVKPSTAYS